MNEILSSIPTPIYICEEKKLINNLEILKSVKERTGCKIILALKAFSMFSVFPLIKKYIDGTAASSLNEARLSFEEFGKETHIYSPAYKESELKKLCNYANHITFNSFSQWNKYKPIISKFKNNIKCGIRINPEYSEIKVPMYNPCAPFSRLGVTISALKNENLTGISGLHFHTLCQQNSDTLEKTLSVIEKNFSQYLYKMEWLNFGGGHHITRKDYDIDKLCHLISHFKSKYNLQIILEPGEAVGLNTGVLITSVLDIIHNKTDIAILDTSAAAHMPDVLEMPYRPEIINSGAENELPFSYRLGGNTCLSGDVIGDYSFKKQLKIGDKLILTDMCIYTMVKNTTFNGINLPSIAIYSKNKELKIIREFGYEDFKNRLS
jgi:carboxynorspermidine decarboxylase